VSVSVYIRAVNITTLKRLRH